MSSRVFWVDRTSDDYFQELAREGRALDLVLIDGSHAVCDVVRDAYLPDELPGPRGIVDLHENYIIATYAAFRYLLDERSYLVRDVSMLFANSSGGR